MKKKYVLIYSTGPNPPTYDSYEEALKEIKSRKDGKFYSIDEVYLSPEQKKIKKDEGSFVIQKKSIRHRTLRFLIKMLG